MVGTSGHDYPSHLEYRNRSNVATWPMIETPFPSGQPESRLNGTVIC